MFADNTVFIVGAGASAEFNLPVGSGLMEQIKRNSRFHFDFGQLREGVHEILNALHESYRSNGEINDRLAAMVEINRSIDLAGSIDEFINRHHNDLMIAEAGKLQIAYAIAKAERESLLAYTKNSNVLFPWEKVDGTWIKTFAQLLFEGVRNEEVEQVGNNITIICFNYDRCIEHYLTEAIIKTFRGVDREGALKIVSRINIIHPYGSLGPLGRHPFGEQIAPHNLVKMSNNIVTWSESVESARKAAIEKAMLSASTLVFLGFAFASQNMNLLTAVQARDSRTSLEVFATGYGYDDVIDDRLKNKIMNLYSVSGTATSEEYIHVQYNMKCAKFLQAHSMALVA
ncbi:SIR2 family protein [Neorhizobium galegae]|uniref:SIR2 family protein n=1 Tax=Neorhizobium galegae TaxID=399 RepID=UPI00210633CE|nr:SIR2 family protein [Neorhizobium galegae]MCQ1772867.1 SIR2 family protein [Neorhizobium galegae]MCQ1799186.1 SIR2 family protein [Neorhizobium galegae]